VNGGKAGLNSYAIIINKCNFLEDEEFQSGGEADLRMLLMGPKMKVATAKTLFAPLHPALKGRNKVLPMPLIKQFILDDVSAPPIIVQEASDIDTRDLLAALEEADAKWIKVSEDIKNLTEAAKESEMRNNEALQKALEQVRLAQEQAQTAQEQREEAEKRAEEAKRPRGSWKDEPLWKMASSIFPVLKPFELIA